MIRLKKKRNNLQIQNGYPGRRIVVPGSGILGRLIPLLLVAAVILFILYPVYCLIRSSVTVDGALDFSRYNGLLRGNRKLLWNSLFSAGLVALCSTALSLAIALRTVMAGPRLRMFLLTVLLCTMVSPPFVGSLAYIQLYGRRGWITYSLLGLSINPYNWRGVVVMQTLTFASMGALFLQGMLEKVDGDLLQSARDLGASPSRAFWTVLLPLVRPGLLANLLLSFIRALADFSTPIVIGGRFNTIAAEIYMQITGYSNLPAAATLNMLIFLPSMVIFLAYRWLMKRSDRVLSASGKTSTGRFHLRVGGATGLVAGLLSLVFFGMMSLQYICIFLSGFLKAVRGKYHFSLEHVRRVLDYDMSSMTRSIAYAVIVGVAGTLFSMLFSYYVERRKIPGRNLLDFVSTMPYMIPGTTFGIGYILAFNNPPLKLTGTAAIVVLNMLFRQIPNSTKICSASLSQIPFLLEDAARDLGAGRLRILTDIILPNLSQAFFTCFAYNFTSAMTTAGAILFLIQPSQKIAVFRLFDAINTGDYGVASLIATMIIAISIAINLGTMALTRGRKRGNGHVFALARAE